MTTTPKPGDRARITNLDSYVNIAHGEVVTIAEVDDTEGCWVGEPDGDLIYIGKRGDGWEPADEFHRITEHSTGPNLEDIFRLIRYLRSVGRACTVTEIARRPSCEAYHRLGVGWHDDLRDYQRNVLEDRPEPEAFYIGPDGALYDCNREAL